MNLEQCQSKFTDILKLTKADWCAGRSNTNSGMFHGTGFMPGAASTNFHSPP